MDSRIAQCFDLENSDDENRYAIDVPIYDEYSEQQLRWAFDAVCNPHNWKNPIDAVIDWTDPRTNTRIVARAITFFTGSFVTFHQTGQYALVRVTAPGYYRAIGP